MQLTKIGQKKLWLGTKITLLFGVFLLFGLVQMAKADNVVKGFAAKETLEAGEVVSLDTSTNTVKAASAKSTNAMYGVVVDPSDAPITLVGQDSKVFVATVGTYQVLVSGANGPINKGDYISMSPTDGIAAKATVHQAAVLGKAENAFNGTTGVISGQGKDAIGRVYVNIAVQKNPISNIDPTLPSFLQKVADSLGDKSVPVIRVYIALLVFAISILATVTILWSGVRSSMISLGRNPLSHHTIFRGMYKVIFTGLAVFIIGLAGVYLLLKI